MKKQNIKLLILDDADMNCDSKTDDLDKIGLENIGFSMLAILGYDMVVYEGTKGSKILKSRYTNKGKIV